MIPCYKKNELQNIQNLPFETSISNKIALEFPCEIGSFLTRKLVLFPESLESAKSIMEKYRQEDLYRVMNALNEAVIDSKFDVAKSEIQELNTILSNVWDDAKKAGKREKLYANVFSLALYALGAAAGGIGFEPEGSSIGFLSALGLTTLSNSTAKLSDRLATELTRRLSRGYTSVGTGFSTRT